MNLDAQLCLRSIFGCHFLFTALVLTGNWPGDSYLFYNAGLLILLIWAEMTPPPDSELPLFKCLVVEALSIFFDVVVMSARYQHNWKSGVDTFALIMAIIHLFGRLPTCFVLFRLREERRSLQYGTAAGGGASTIGGGTGVGGLFGGGTQASPGGYEEFPPAYGGGGGASYGPHDTKPLPP